MSNEEKEWKMLPQAEENWFAEYAFEVESPQDEDGDTKTIEVIAYANVEKIVEEAMRRGEVKAWEEAKKLVTASTPNHLARDYRETDAMRDAINGLINAKLTELKK